MARKQTHSVSKKSLSAFLEKIWLPLVGIPLDAVLLFVSFWLAYLLRFNYTPLIALFPPTETLQFSLVCDRFYAIIAIWLLVFYYSAKLYKDLVIRAPDIFVRVLHGCVFSVAITLFFAFMSGPWACPLLICVIAMPIATVLVFISNLALRALRVFLFRQLKLHKRILIVGGGQSVESARSRLKTESCLNLDHVHKIDKQDFFARLEKTDIHCVMLSNAGFSMEDMLEIADKIESMGIDLYIVPGILELRFGEVQIDRRLGIPILRIHHTSFSEVNYWLKRVVDLLLCAVVAVLGAIPFLLVALCIKIESPGPVLYRQKRYGYKGQVFEIYKFRTMYTGAELKVKELAQDSRSGNGPYFKLKKDPRITKSGKWLRRFSMDEFPQFINVFFGEMSIVGPRPLAVSSGEKEALEAQMGPFAMKVFNVLPGITGLWQVSGRSDLDHEQRFSLDLYYLEHWSIGLDLYIMLRTPIAILSKRGAY